MKTDKDVLDRLEENLKYNIGEKEREILNLQGNLEALRTTLSTLQDFRRQAEENERRYTLKGIYR